MISVRRIRIIIPVTPSAQSLHGQQQFASFNNAVATLLGQDGYESEVPRLFGGMNQCLAICLWLSVRIMYLICLS